MNLSKITSGKNPPSKINVVVEITQGSSVKCEVDKTSGVLIVDRFLYSSITFPSNYGFIPHTISDDGDPVDVILISSLPVTPGIVVPSRPIGILKMEDEAGVDNKIVALPEEDIDPSFAKIKDVSKIDDHRKERIKHFFERYKELEPGKWVKVKGFLSREFAEKEIKKSLSAKNKTGEA